MIDSSVHILPGVDDGATDEEIAIYMLEKAKADGITHWIVTPHFNHESSKYTYDVLRKKYDEWFQVYGETYAGGNLIFGVDVFIDDIFLENIGKMSRLPTFENSHYMLVTFDLNSTFEKIKDAVITLKAYGIIPILAHVENYPDLVKNPYKVKLLSEEDVLIQLTASSFLSKNHQKFIRELMIMNAVDLVASNGYDSTNRPPILSDSYNYVERFYSKAWANRLFNESPLKVFYGEHYFRPLNTVKLRKSYRVSMGVSVAFGIMLIAVGISQMSDQTPQLIADSEEIITEEAIPAGFVSVLSYDEIIAQGKEQLDVITFNYEVDLSVLHDQLFSTYNEIPNFNTFTAQFDTYLSKATALEIQYDTIIMNTLKELEETLEINGFSTGVIEGFKSDYSLFKESIITKYFGLY